MCNPDRLPVGPIVAQATCCLRCLSAALHTHAASRAGRDWNSRYTPKSAAVSCRRQPEARAQQPSLGPRDEGRRSVAAEGAWVRVRPASGRPDDQARQRGERPALPPHRQRLVDASRYVIQGCGCGFAPRFACHHAEQVPSSTNARAWQRRRLHARWLAYLTTARGYAGHSSCITPTAGTADMSARPFS